MKIKSTAAGGTLSALGLGAGIMYCLDPERGAKRRARIRDASAHSLHRSSDFLAKAARDAVNRSIGLVAVARHSIGGEEQIEDSILTDRVRAKLGRYVSHPHAIEVTVVNGRVRLRGLILEHEVSPLIEGVARVPGIREVVDDLEPHLLALSPSGSEVRIPALEGGIPRAGERPDILQEYWAPATRILVGLIGGGLAARGFFRRDGRGWAMGLVGSAALLRAGVNRPLRRALGFEGPSAIVIHKSVNFDAPVERVFRFWSDLENFPRFMKVVRTVEVADAGRSHWKVAGPFGLTLDWTAEITRLEENCLLAWRTLPGSTVTHAGILRFHPNEKGGTRIDLELSYSPPGGVLGGFVAWLLGTDAKTRLDESLAELKSRVEKADGPLKMAV